MKLKFFFLLAATATAHAFNFSASESFNDAASAARLSALENGVQNSNVGFDAAAGIASGGLRFQSTGDLGLDHRFYGIHDPDAVGPLPPTSLNSTTINQWSASIKVRMADLSLLEAGQKTKAHVRLGFVGNPVVTDPLKPQESLNKPPQTSSVFADFKVEWENGTETTKQPKISVEVKSFNGTLEIKPPSKFEQTYTTGDPIDNAALLQGWYLVTVTATRTSLSSNQYLLTGIIHSLGADGTSTPVLVGMNTFPIAPANAALAADPDVYPFLFLETAKEVVPGSPGSTFTVDDWTIATSSEPGPEPPPLPNLYPAPGGGAQGLNVLIPFESVNDLDGFTYTNQNFTTLGYAAVNGAGTPATGAGAFQSTATGAVDRRVLAVSYLSERTVSAPETQEWSSRVLINASSMSATPALSKYKAHARIGFLGSANIPDPTKPQEVWKQNAGIHADFKIEWENKTGSLPKISIEAKSSEGGGQETRTPVKFESTAFNAAHWFIAELTVRRMVDRDNAALIHLLQMEARVYDAGPDGRSEPVLMGGTEYGGVLRFSNAPFSQDTTVHSAIMLEGERAYAGTPYYNYFIDDLSFATVRRAELVQPPAPPPVLAIGLDAQGRPVLTWNDVPGWVLQRNDALATGTWATVVGAASPYLIPTGAEKAFFRMAKF